MEEEIAHTVIKDCSADLVPCDPARALAVSAAVHRWDGEDIAVFAALGAAALYICWPDNRTWPVLPRPRRYRLGTDLLDYGADILAGLVGAGLKVTTLMGSLHAAIDMAQLGALTQQEVREASDFCEAPTGG